MPLRRLSFGMLLFSLCSLAAAQAATCRDAADEPHHRVVLESSAMRVLFLELPRVASTESFCYANPYVYIVLGEGKSSTTAEGEGTFSRDWSGSETRLIYGAQKQVVRNESGRTFREVIVELDRLEPYDPLTDTYESDMFAGDLGTLRPTWTVSVNKGGIRFSKVQLAPGDTFPLNAAGHLLIALNDLSLQRTAQGNTDDVQLAAQELNNLNAGPASKLTNSGHNAARFVLIEY